MKNIVTFIRVSNIKKLSHNGVRIISIEVTLDENDSLFTEIYNPISS